MRKIFLTVLVAVFPCWAAFSQQQGERVQPIPAAEAGKMIGTNAVVVGRVAEVNQTEKVIRLNFERKFPKQVFTAVVFAKNFGLFTNLAGLEGKTVEISGKVEDYRGHPQTILHSKGQLRLVDADKPVPPTK